MSGTPLPSPGPLAVAPIPLLVRTLSKPLPGPLNTAHAIPSPLSPRPPLPLRLRGPFLRDRTPSPDSRMALKGNPLLHAYPSQLATDQWQLAANPQPYATTRTRRPYPQPVVRASSPSKWFSQSGQSCLPPLPPLQTCRMLRGIQLVYPAPQRSTTLRTVLRGMQKQGAIPVTLEMIS